MPATVLILRAPGTNCDQETAFAFQQAGATTEILHINRLLEAPQLFERFQILCIPGGFSYGDDVAAGRILGNQIQHHLADALTAFKEAGKLILGICNGFQVLIKSGVLLDGATPSDEAGQGEAGQGAAATLTWNDSGKFEDRWVRLKVCGSKSVFLQGIGEMYLPVAHAEGKFVTRDADALAALNDGQQLALRYMPLKAERTCRCGGQAAGSLIGNCHGSLVPYPDNPNGSVADVAGVCDATGRVLGLMPHPERHIDPTQHPRWTRGEAGTVGDGLKLFENAVAFFAY